MRFLKLHSCFVCQIRLKNLTVTVWQHKTAPWKEAIKKAHSDIQKTKTATPNQKSHLRSIIVPNLRCVVVPKAERNSKTYL